MASKEDKKDIRNAKRTVAKISKSRIRIPNSAAVEYSKSSKASVKAGTTTTGGRKYESSGSKAANTNSATKPSMPVKTGAKNKMKAQGAKAMSAPTSGYGKSTKPKK